MTTCSTWNISAVCLLSLPPLCHPLFALGSLLWRGGGMACSPEILRKVPLFSLLDDDETAILAAQVELKSFTPRQRIYKIGAASGRASVMVSGRVRVTPVDEDQQEVVVD